jgi:hypothetical protein
MFQIYQLHPIEPSYMPFTAVNTQGDPEVLADIF